MAGSLALPAVARAGVLADWTTLASAWECPEWFRDAKFGIWSHWGPQCVPEYGDWYGRQMYLQGNHVYRHHVETYGHPAEFGFIDLIGRWKADKWDPEALAEKYRRAGARYIVSMASHHDNFDMFASRHHGWNATMVGPKTDIVGRWEKATRAAGLRFGISNHSSHAWHWWQPAYGYDVEGPRMGERYDAFRLTAADGKGRFWEGLDPQDLYTGPNMLIPDGIDSIEAMNRWHGARDGQWLEMVPPGNEAFARKWLARQMDFVEQYRPDLVYFDDSRLPFGQYGLDAVAHFYDQATLWHGSPDVVLTAKRLGDYQREAIMEDVERGFVADIRPEPWQTCTCIGNWHYDRELYERHGYKGAKLVIQRLADIVSKNGNLLLSVPMRGDGSIDADEEVILADLARWTEANGEAIYGTRPWRVFGEGPTQPPTGLMAEHEAAPFTAQDVRFTTKGDAVHAIFLDWPDDARIETFRLGQGTVERVETGAGRPVSFTQRSDALHIDLPRPQGGEFVPVVRIYGAGLV
ncbi:alpha-L-fucosidase [Altererythrobacter salegens]|uniref:alpha-L-fucosidase n=1 Tax=Croceibacterium salegens TaxID=1737568 RepID=A0A6I4SZ90_9SPHN|nr:alpha-L-fucosidase [Croceibacterium salegens]